MPGWFRKAKPSASVDAMEAAFHASIRQVRTDMSASQQAAVGYGVAFAWRAFNSKFASGEDCMRKFSAIKTDFIHSIEKMHNAMAERNDAEVAAGMALANMYFAALVALSERTGNAAMVNRMADQLEPFNKEGSTLLNIGPL